MQYLSYFNPFSYSSYTVGPARNASSVSEIKANNQNVKYLVVTQDDIQNALKNLKKTKKVEKPKVQEGGVLGQIKMLNENKGEDESFSSFVLKKVKID